MKHIMFILFALFFRMMTAFGDEGKLTPQQIADVIAYVISLNK